MSYTYIRYKWEKGADMQQLEETLQRSYTVGRRDFPGNEIEISLFKEDRRELIVTADRMRAHINAHRAILSKIEEGPFTSRDMELRAFIFENYPRSRPTPFPWSHNFEPDFEVEE